MNNKIIKILIIIALALILGIAAGFEFKKGKSTTENNNDSIPMEIKTIKELDNFFKVEVEYPQFKNIDSVFNQKIADLVTTKISDFKKESTANWEARRATSTPEYPVPETPEQPFDFQVTWEPTQTNNNYLSFTMTIYYFTGGAHGAEEIYSFNYDIKNKKEITINDFLGSPQLLQKISELTAQDITTQLESKGMQIDDFLKQMIKDGTAPTVENFSIFNFSKNALIIYFQRYQVAPGAVGSLTVSLYKNTLTENGIKSDYLE